jgi:hypothetical protein
MLSQMAPKPAGPPAGGGSPPAQLPPIGSATGAPSPSMAGKIPTGAGAVPSKVALGTAIQALREVKSQYPDASGDMDKWITQLQSLANPSSAGLAQAAAQPDSPDN